MVNNSWINGEWTSHDIYIYIYTNVARKRFSDGEKTVYVYTGNPPLHFMTINHHSDSSSRLMIFPAVGSHPVFVAWVLGLETGQETNHFLGPPSWLEKAPYQRCTSTLWESNGFIVFWGHFWRARHRIASHRPLGWYTAHRPSQFVEYSPNQPVESSRNH